jgi:hypothetical protein
LAVAHDPYATQDENKLLHRAAGTVERIAPPEVPQHRDRLAIAEQFTSELHECIAKMNASQKNPSFLSSFTPMHQMLVQLSISRSAVHNTFSARSRQAAVNSLLIGNIRKRRIAKQ